MIMYLVVASRPLNPSLRSSLLFIVTASFLFIQTLVALVVELILKQRSPVMNIFTIDIVSPPKIFTL